MLQVNLRQAIHKTTSSVNTIPSPVISRPTTRLLPGIHPSLSLEEEESGPGDGVDAGIVSSTILSPDLFLRHAVKR